MLGSLERRWAHVQGVAAAASALGRRVLQDRTERELLVSSAWLHDIGYASALVISGCHHLDGAMHLAELGQTSLARLVAHHGSAVAEARLRGLRAELDSFPPVPGMLADLLTYCDLTTSPEGTSVSLGDRVAEVERRYGPGHVVTCGLMESRSELFACAERVESALRRAGHPVSDLAR